MLGHVKSGVFKCGQTLKPEDRLHCSRERCGQKKALYNRLEEVGKGGKLPFICFYFYTESVAGSKGRKTGIKEGKKKAKATIQGI